MKSSISRSAPASITITPVLVADLLGCSSVMPVSTKHARIWMIDDVNVDRHPLALS